MTDPKLLAAYRRCKVELDAYEAAYKAAAEACSDALFALVSAQMAEAGWGALVRRNPARNRHRLNHWNATPDSLMTLHDGEELRIASVLAQDGEIIAFCHHRTQAKGRPWSVYANRTVVLWHEDAIGRRLS